MFTSTTAVYWHSKIHAEDENRIICGDLVVSTLTNRLLYLARTTFREAGRLSTCLLVYVSCLCDGNIIRKRAENFQWSNHHHYWTLLNSQQWVLGKDATPTVCAKENTQNSAFYIAFHFIPCHYYINTPV